VWPLGFSVAFAGEGNEVVVACVLDFLTFCVSFVLNSHLLILTWDSFLLSFFLFHSHSIYAYAAIAISIFSLLNISDLFYFILFYSTFQLPHHLFYFFKENQFC